jgi:oligopeptidase B
VTADEIPPAPVAAVREHVREHHGDRVVDPYEWLRDAEDPEVIAHLEAENAHARARTEHLEPLRQRLFAEIKGRVQETDLTVPVASGPWWYYSRTVEGQQYAVHARSPLSDPTARPDLSGGAIAGEEVLLDGNAEAGESDFFALGALAVSHDHARLAYATDRTGDERFDLVVKDIATGAVLDDAITEIGYGVELSRDGRFVFYTRLDDAWRPHQLWRHAVGADPATDVLVHQEDDERFWMGVGSSRDEEWLILSLGSRTTSEVRLLRSADPEGEWHVVSPRREGLEYDVEPAGERLFIVHNRDNVESDLAWAPAEATSAEEWRPLLSGGPGERFLGVDAFDDFAVLSLRKDGLTALRVIPLREGAAQDGFGAPYDLTFDEPIHSVGLGDNPEPGQRRVLVTHESYVTPRSVLEVDLGTGERIVLKQQPVLGDFDPQHYAQARAWATATDGTRVPVSIVHRADLARDGRAPGLLSAYAAYEISSDPYFSVARLSLLDRGVVFAVAHARGGGEMGRHWYDDGKLLAKPHSFDDTVAAARLLVDEGWVAADRLGLEGGSAGGLLVGAVVNRAPELFRVVHAAVPFVDALTTILRPDLPLTVGEWEEWGNPLADPEVYACMKAYTPYENIAARPYPAVLATTSLHDTRVFFTEPAKWVARLRATVTNDPLTRPILLRTEMAAGHGGRSGRYAAWEQIAWEWAFVLDQLDATSLS